MTRLGKIRQWLSCRLLGRSPQGVRFPYNHLEVLGLTGLRPYVPKDPCQPVTSDPDPSEAVEGGEPHI